MSETAPDIPAAAYLPTEDPAVFESTALAAAGWYADGQHGGVVSALLARQIEAVPTLTPMSVGRLTVELFRVVPTVPLRVTTQVLREGKRIQVVSASAWNGDQELARAVGLKLRVADLDLPSDALPAAETPPPPSSRGAPDMQRWGVGSTGRVMFHRHAIEIREVEGSYRELGPAAIWLRLTHPLVADEEPSPLQRAVVCGDFANGVSRMVHSSEWVFMNADLTIHLHRQPQGEWIGLRAVSRYDRTGRAVATGELFDLDGPVGRSTQTLFVDRASGGR